MPQQTPTGSKALVQQEEGYFEELKDSQGRFRTRSLFIEHSNDSYPAYFTLKKHDVEVEGKNYMSLYRKYMEIADPTEYQVAFRLLGAWDHWQALKRSQWFTVHLTGWRKELKDRMESDRYHEMLLRSSEPGPQGLQAIKWLATRYGGSSDKVSKRGRPSKEEKAAHLIHSTKESEDLADDLKRLGMD